MKSLAPEEEELPANEAGQDRLDLLASLLPDLEGQPAAEEEISSAPATDEPAPAEVSDAPDWLREMEMTSSSTTIIGPEDELGAWFATETEEPQAAQPSAQAETPAEEPVEAAQSTESPTGSEWFAETGEQAPQAQSAAVSSEESVLPAGAEDLDSALAWLESLAAQHGAEEETLITKPEDRLSAPPEWVREEADQPEPEQTAESVQEASVEAEQPAETAAVAPPAFELGEAQIFEIFEEPVAQPEQSGAVSNAQIFETPEEALADSQEASQEPEAPEWAQAAAGAQMFDILEETSPEAPLEAAAETPAETQAAPQAEAAFDAMPDLSDEAAAFAWLELLAAQHGAEEETLLTRPEDRLETPPEWLQGETEEEPGSEPQAEAEPVDTAAETEAVEAQLPTWLDEIAFNETGHREVKKEDELLDWFEELDTPSESLETTAAQPAIEPAEEAAPAEDVPDWLRALEQEETAPAEAAGDVPEWLQEVSPPVQTAGLEELGIASEPGPEAASQPEPAREEEFVGMDESEADTQKVPVQPLTIEEPEDVETPVEPIAPETIPTAWETAALEEAALETPALEVVSEEVTSQEPVPLANLFPEETAAAEPEPAQEAAPKTRLEVEEVRAGEEQPEVVPVEAVELQPEEDALAAVETQPEETQPEVIETEVVEDQPAAIETEVVGEPQAETQPVKTEAAQEFEEGEASPVQAQATEAEASAAEETPSPVVPGQEMPVTETVSASLHEQARQNLDKGQIETAVEQYNQMIEFDQMLPGVIQDLRDALYRHPVDVSLWQTLGDAYLHNNQIQDALDSYTKAEELLR